MPPGRPLVALEDHGPQARLKLLRLLVHLAPGGPQRSGPPRRWNGPGHEARYRPEAQSQQHLVQGNIAGLLVSRAQALAMALQK